MFDRRSYTFRTISLGASVSRKPRHCRRMSSGEISRCLSPHPGGDALLLFTDGVCINCRGSEAAKCSYWVFRTIYDKASLIYG